MSKPVYRRLSGLIVGGLIGLGFALVAALINPILMPDIKFYIPPFGIFGNALLGLGAGMILGLLSAWTNPSVPGPIFAGMVGAALMLLSGFISGRTPLFLVPASVVTALFLLLPFSAMLLPLTALIRVAVNQFTDYRDKSILLPRRWVMTVLLLAAAVGGGLLFRLSPEAQIMLRRAQSMIDAGLQVTNVEALPAPLIGPEMRDFIGSAGQSYQLEWQNKNLNLYAIPRPALPEYEMAVVIAHFDNGWSLVCLYPNTELNPRCKGFDELPQPQASY